MFLSNVNKRFVYIVSVCNMLLLLKKLIFTVYYNLLFYISLTALNLSTLFCYGILLTIFYKKNMSCVYSINGTDHLIVFSGLRSLWSISRMPINVPIFQKINT